MPGMINSERKQEFKDLAQAFGLAVLVHLGFLVLMIAGTWDWPTFDQQPPPVRVSLVDMGPIVEQRRAEERAEREAEQARQQEIERQRRAEQEARQEQQRRIDEQRQRELEQQRAEQAERDRLADERRQREEQQRLLEEERRRVEEEQLRELAELRAQREEAQRRREEEEQRMAEIAERRAAEEADRRAVEEAERLRLAQQQADADARRATLGEEYSLTIAELVRREWNRPPTTRPGVRCDVRVFQIPGGEIIDVAIVSPCNADDATRRSIEAAVRRVGELPYRGYESVFQRELVFTFRYDG